MDSELAVSEKRLQARRNRLRYGGILASALIAGGSAAYLVRASSVCLTVADRLCAWEETRCRELRAALSKRESVECARALRGLDTADRLPSHLRPAMMAQVHSDLTGQTDKFEELAAELRDRGSRADGGSVEP